MIEVLRMIVGVDIALQVWFSLEEHLLTNTKEKEIHLKDNILSLKSLSIEEYIRKFKSLCDNLADINKPMSNVDKVFQLAKGLGPKYQDFCLAMLIKPLYPTFNQFVLSLQSYE